MLACLLFPWTSSCNIADFVRQIRMRKTVSCVASSVHCIDAEDIPPCFNDLERGKTYHAGVFTGGAARRRRSCWR